MPPAPPPPVPPAPTAPSKAPTRRSAYERVAREVLRHLVEGKWSKATERFGESMKKALPAWKLTLAYKAQELRSGAHRRVLRARVKPMGRKGVVVDLECAFAKKNANVRVALDRRKRVVGLFFMHGWNPPPYVDRRAFEERVVTVGGRLSLPGTLTMPHGDGPFPAVVLVHGSGPNDRDETSGPNKIFKDLAWGLARRRIAVLRYEKRTEYYRGKPSVRAIQTVKGESIDDARSAVALLSKTKKVDPRRIVVVGHSLGAMLAPRIAKEESRVGAVVLLAGPTRPEGQIWLEQTRYLVGLSTRNKQQQQQAIRAAQKAAQRLDSKDLKPDERVLGIPGRYWIDLREHHGAKIAPTLEIPILVLQGGRDYQVTMVDFRGWKKALAGRPKVTFKVYPKLNHHFMPGKGPSTPSEYAVPSHVPRTVIDDIARWIQAL